jgi:ABC-2 type transport system permease protein
MGPLREAGHAGGLRDVIRKRYLLWLLIRKDIKVRYAASVLGIVWSYSHALARFCVYLSIASFIIPGKTPSRLLHVFSGYIMLQFFSGVLGAGCKSVVKNKSLLRKIYLPREMLPIASVATTFYNVIPMFVMLFIGDALQHWRPDVGALVAAALALGIMAVYGLALAIGLSAVTVFFRDTSNLVDMLSTVLRWTAPVIYTYTVIKPKLMEHPWLNEIYVSNPFNAAVMLNNRAFWIPAFQPTEKHPDAIAYGVATQMPTHLFERSIIIFASGFVLLFIAQWFFRRVEGRFADKL